MVLKSFATSGIGAGTLALNHAAARRGAGVRVAHPTARPMKQGLKNYSLANTAMLCYNCQNHLRIPFDISILQGISVDGQNQTSRTKPIPEPYQAARHHPEQDSISLSIRIAWNTRSRPVGQFPMSSSVKSITYKTIAAACIVLLAAVSFALYTAWSVERSSRKAALALAAVSAAERLSFTHVYRGIELPRPAATDTQAAEEIKRLGSAIAAIDESTSKQPFADTGTGDTGKLLSDWEAARKALAEPMSERAAAALAGLTDALTEYAEASGVRTTAQSKRLLSSVAVLSLAALAAVGLTALLIIRMLIGPLEAASITLAASEAVGFARPVNFGSAGEMVRLAASVNAAIDTLRKDAGNYRRSLYAAPFAILELDEYGSITSANREAERLAGETGGAVAGRPFAELISAESAQTLRAALETVFRGGVVRGCELQMTSRSCDTSLVELYATPVARGGSFAGCICVLKDLDETKKFMAELEKTRQDFSETSRRLTDTIKDLEDFALLAVRRELKMQEIRDMFKKLQDDTGASRKAHAKEPGLRVKEFPRVDKDHA